MLDKFRAKYKLIIGEVVVGQWVVTPRVDQRVKQERSCREGRRGLARSPVRRSTWRTGRGQERGIFVKNL